MSDKEDQALPGGSGGDQLGSAEDAGSSRKRRRRSSSNESSSSDSDSSHYRVKRKKKGKSDIQDLTYQVNALTNLLWQRYFAPTNQSESPQPCAPPQPASTTLPPGQDAPSTSEPVAGPSLQSLNLSLNRPAAVGPGGSVDPPRLDLGGINTAVKTAKIPAANPKRVKQLEILQRFDNSNWKEVRYADVLKSYNGTPGFVDLELNDGLRQFKKGKDYIASSERVLAALSNAILEQRDLLNQSLQQLVDWAASLGDSISASSMFEKVTELFQSNSKFHKTSEDIMQLVCGKRAEYIELRRERILSELPNKNLREGLRKIPPSSQHLFNDSLLHSYINNTGGIDKWIRPWFNSKQQTSNQTKNRHLPVDRDRDIRDRSFRPSRPSEAFNKQDRPNAAVKQSAKGKKPFKKDFTKERQK